MKRGSTLPGLFATAAITTLTSCGGGGGSPSPAGSPPVAVPPAPSREGYARLVGAEGTIARIDPTALTRLVPFEPAGTITDSAVVYDAEVDAAIGVASNIATRYVLYTQAGRLYRYDLRDGGVAVQVSSRSDLCYFQSVNGLFDLPSTALVLNTVGTNASCFRSSPMSGRAVVSAAAQVTDAGRSVGHQSELAITSADGARVGWLVFSTTALPANNAVGYSASPDLSAAPVPLGSVPRMPRWTINVPGGAYVNVDDLELDYRFFSVATNAMVAAPSVRGRVIGRDQNYAYLMNYPGSGGDYEILRLDLRAPGPATPTLVGRVATAFSRGVGVSSGALWFIRPSVPFEVAMMPVAGGAPVVVGTMSTAPNGRERVIEFGDRVVIAGDEGREFFLHAPGAQATVRCCFAQFQATALTPRGFSANRLIYARATATGTELISLDPVAGTQVTLGTVPPAGVALSFQFTGYGYSHGSIITAKRTLPSAGGGAMVVQVLTARVDVPGSLAVAVAP